MSNCQRLNLDVNVIVDLKPFNVTDVGVNFNGVSNGVESSNVVMPCTQAQTFIKMKWQVSSPVLEQSARLLSRSLALTMREN